MGQIALSPALRALDTHDLRRGLRAHGTNRTLACISRARHARSPQRVARAPDKSPSRLHFAHSTRTISAEGCARMGHIALSPAFRATHDLHRGLRGHRTNRTLACISRTRHARSSQRVVTGQIALSPAFRALDTHDLRRGLRTSRTLACISRTRHARFLQRVARAWDKSHSRSPAFRSLDTHDLRRGLRVKSPKRAFSYETSSKTHRSKSAKRAFRTRLPPKVKRKHPSEHTHHAALPSSFAIPAPPDNIRSHANSKCDSDTHLYHNSQPHDSCACHESFRVHTSNAHKVLHLPRNVTSVTPRNLTIPCACHENRTSTPQHPHKVLRACHEK